MPSPVESMAANEMLFVLDLVILCDLFHHEQKYFRFDGAVAVVDGGDDDVDDGAAVMQHLPVPLPTDPGIDDWNLESAPINYRSLLRNTILLSRLSIDYNSLCSKQCSDMEKIYIAWIEHPNSKLSELFRLYCLLWIFVDMIQMAVMMMMTIVLNLSGERMETDVVKCQRNAAIVAFLHRESLQDCLEEDRVRYWTITYRDFQFRVSEHK